MNLDRRLSSEQVATGLKLIWDEDTQGHHGPFDLNMPVKAFFDHIDSEMWPLTMNWLFGCRIWFDVLDEFAKPAGVSRNEVKARIARLTVADLVEFLRNKLPPNSLRPISIAGHECPKAAAFLAIERLVPTSRWSQPRPIAPSMKLRERLSQQELNALMVQLQCLVAEQLLPGFKGIRSLWQQTPTDSTLTRSSRDNAAMCLFAGFMSAFAFIIPGNTATTILWGCIALVTGFNATLEFVPTKPQRTEGLVPLYLELPNSIVTFRDLAALVATTNGSSVANFDDTPTTLFYSPPFERSSDSGR